MREIVKILPFGLLLPLVIGAASVKPDDAISNIGAWAHTLGFESLSRWLANPASDNRVIVASMALSVLYSFVIFTLPALKEHRKNPTSERLKIHFLTMGFYFYTPFLLFLFGDLYLVRRLCPLRLYLRPRQAHLPCHGLVPRIFRLQKGRVNS
ncbi:hypothetical protein [Bradyrhizobium sp.]|jgi:hypothetical protein|uniref:hypothetical protein n=1 Tax=Bradyrhizobium sp. TaxID=376 RepID=UPI003C172B54